LGFERSFLITAMPFLEGRIDIFPCKRNCRKYVYCRRHPIMPDVPIRKGKTIFLTNHGVSPDIEERGIDQLVIQPVMPM